MFGTPEILGSLINHNDGQVPAAPIYTSVPTWPAIYAMAQNRQSQLLVITMHCFKVVIPHAAIRAICVLPTASAETPTSMIKRITHGSSDARIRHSQILLVGTTAIKSTVSSTRVSSHAISYSYRRYTSASISMSSGRHVVLQ
jgi:hypothetical protein